MPKGMYRKGMTSTWGRLLRASVIRRQSDGSFTYTAVFVKKVKPTKSKGGE